MRMNSTYSTFLAWSTMDNLYSLCNFFITNFVKPTDSVGLKLNKRKIEQILRLFINLDNFSFFFLLITQKAFADKNALKRM